MIHGRLQVVMLGMTSAPQQQKFLDGPGDRATLAPRDPPTTATGLNAARISSRLLDATRPRWTLFMPLTNAKLPVAENEIMETICMSGRRNIG